MNHGRDNSSEDSSSLHEHLLPYRAAIDSYDQYLKDRLLLEDNMRHTYKDLLNQFNLFYHEYLREKNNATMWQKMHDTARNEAQMAEKTLNDMKKANESAPSFAYLIVDGDGAVFRDDLIMKGEEGGAAAAHELYKQIKEYLSDGKFGWNIDQIFVQVVLNVAGLGTALKLPETLVDFGRGFCRAQPLFTFVDIGRGKERADHKIRKLFEAMVRNQQCKCLMLAGLHDNGYATFLDQYSYGDHTKICLLETTPAAKEFRSFASVFDRISFPSVFRSDPLITGPGASVMKLPTQGHPGRTISVPNLFASQVAPGGVPSPASPAPARPDTPGTPASSTALPVQRPAAPVAAPQATSWADLSKAGTNGNPTMINIATASKKKVDDRLYYQLNRLDERIDSIKGKPDNAAKAGLEEKMRKNGINFCNNWHLIGRCRQNNCPYIHGERLSHQEQLALWGKSRSRPCQAGARCREFDCTFGHHCLFITTTSGMCGYGAKCNFQDTHDMDTTPTLKVYEDGTREVINN